MLSINVQILDPKRIINISLSSQARVSDARAAVAKESGDTLTDFSLYKPKSANSPGIWLKDDDPLAYYEIEDALEWRKHFRPIRILQLSGTFTTHLVNDTLPVSALASTLLSTLGHKSCFSLDQIEGDDNREILFPDMTLREQGFIGELTLALFSSSSTPSTDPLDYGMFVQIPFWEGEIQRKGKGFMKKWVKKWFILRKNKLSAFKAADDPEEIESFSLKNLIKVGKFSGKDSSIPSKQRDLVIELHFQGEGPELFLTETPEDFRQLLTLFEIARRTFAIETVFFSSPKPLARPGTQVEKPSTGLGGLLGALNAIQSQPAASPSGSSRPTQQSPLSKASPAPADNASKSKKTRSNKESRHTKKRTSTLTTTSPLAAPTASSSSSSSSSTPSTSTSSTTSTTTLANPSNLTSTHSPVVQTNPIASPTSGASSPIVIASSDASAKSPNTSIAFSTSTSSELVSPSHFTTSSPLSASPSSPSPPFSSSPSLHSASQTRSPSPLASTPPHATSPSLDSPKLARGSKIFRSGHADKQRSSSGLSFGDLLGSKVSKQKTSSSPDLSFTMPLRPPPGPVSVVYEDVVNHAAVMLQEWTADGRLARTREELAQSWSVTVSKDSTLPSLTAPPPPQLTPSHPDIHAHVDAPGATRAGLLLQKLRAQPMQVESVDALHIEIAPVSLLISSPSASSLHQWDLPATVAWIEAQLWLGELAPQIVKAVQEHQLTADRLVVMSDSELETTFSIPSNSTESSSLLQELQQSLRTKLQTRSASPPAPASSTINAANPAPASSALDSDSDSSDSSFSEIEDEDNALTFVLSSDVLSAQPQSSSSDALPLPSPGSDVVAGSLDMFASFQFDSIDIDALCAASATTSSESLSQDDSSSDMTPSSSSPSSSSSSSNIASHSPQRQASQAQLRFSPILKKKYLSLSPTLAGLAASPRLSYIAAVINAVCAPHLAKDPFLNLLLPVQPSEVLAVLADGVVLAKVANIFAPNSVDESLLVIPSTNLAHIRQNLTLLVGASQQKLCLNPRLLPNLAITGLIQQNPEQAALFVLNFIGVILSLSVSPARSPSLLSLLQAGESISDAKNISVPDYLQRWLQAKSQLSTLPSYVDQPQTFLSSFLISAKHIFQHPVPQLPALSESLASRLHASDGLDQAAQASLVVDILAAVGVPPYFTVDHLTGDPILNFHVLCLFYPLVSFHQESLMLRSLLGSDLRSSPDASAIRSLTTWVASLQIIDPNTHQPIVLGSNLIDLIKGVDLLDAIMATVSNSTLDRPPITLIATTGTIFSRIERANKIILHCHNNLHLKITDISGNEIVSGTSSSIISLLHALRRYDYEHFPLSPGQTNPPAVQVLEQWANREVQNCKIGARRIKNFGDRSMANCIFFFILLKAIFPSSVNLALVNAGGDPHRRFMNASYLVYCLRSLGISGFEGEELNDCSRSLFEFIFRRLFLLSQSSSS